MRGRASVRDRLAEVGPEAAGISVVTLAELFYGAAYSARPEANQQAVNDFTAGIAIMGMDPAIAHTFGDIKAELRRRGELIEDLDLIIAATARTYDLTLVTNNTEHFRRILDLCLGNWT